MISLQRQLEFVTIAIREHIIPVVNDDYTKGQCVAITEMLMDIMKKSDWSIDYLSRLWILQLDTIRQLSEAFSAHDAALPRALERTTEAICPGHALKGKIERNDKIFCDLLQGEERPGRKALADAARMILRDYLSRQTKIEFEFSHHPEINEIAKNRHG